MSKLIQLRQRSKAIETIQKVTHAMRLISMSTHAHLQQRQTTINNYVHELDKVFYQLMAHAPEWHNPIVHGPHEYRKAIVIVIGSQKGLCGSFNTQLFNLFTQRAHEQAGEQFELIAIGQRVIDFMREHKINVKHSYAKFTFQRLESIAREVAHTIIHSKPQYTSVGIFSNLFKTFFVHRPHITTMVPLEIPKNIEISSIDAFTWNQSPAELLDLLIPQYLESKLQYLLFHSLIAEHAAHFISMDSATRNAKELLELNTLEYNKLRQTKITKELAELSGSYE